MLTIVAASPTRIAPAIPPSANSLPLDAPIECPDAVPEAPNGATDQKRRELTRPGPPHANQPSTCCQNAAPGSPSFDGVTSI